MPEHPWASSAPHAAIVALGLMACSGTGEPNARGPRVAIDIAPLSLPDVGDACYRLTVDNGAGQTVWQAPHVCSKRFGDGRGDITWIGSCDAASNDNVVRVELEDLFTAGGATIDRATYQNPCGHSDNGNDDGFAACSRSVRCVEDADVTVAFDLTVMRDAKQGFFDVAVEFEDVFCSAKVDCQSSLLTRPGAEERGPTVVLGFACTSGQGQPTWLHMSDVAVVCGDTWTWLDPHAGPGQLGAQSAAVWQLATYRGQEQLPGLDKCYWNLAIGLDVATGGVEPAARDCRLVGYATASQGPFGDARRSPVGTVHPYVAFEVPLTDGDAGFVCGEQSLNVPGSGVATRYTGTDGKDFPWEWQCDAATTLTESRVLCGTQSGATVGTFVETPGGIVFGHGAKKSPLYQLPSGLALDGCCGNPCPACQGAAR